MDTTVEQTRVHFRIFPQGDVIALFPEQIIGEGLINSYQHIGQHGAAAWNGMGIYCRRATSGQYRDLLQELQSIGYENLKIQKRFKHIPGLK